MLNGLTTAIGTDGDGLGAATILPLRDLSWRGLAAICERSLWAGDADETERIVTEALRRRVDLGIVYDGIVAPALQRVGDLWDPSHVPALGRLLPSDTALAAMRAVTARSAGRRDRPSRRVVFATDAEERHTIGLQMAADVLEDAGHEAIRCAEGARLEAVIDAVLKNDADAVAISCTTDASGDHLATTAASLWEELPGLPIVVGGRGVRPHLPVGPIARVDSLDDLLAAVVLAPRRS
jgi:methanogenic corrinoid protein MtbC1